MGTKFDEFLTQGFNPKGVLIWMVTKDINDKIQLTVK